MAKEKTRKAGEAGPHLCWCGACECETQEECLDPNTGCKCQSQRPAHCCRGSQPEEPLLVVTHEQPLLVPAHAEH